MRQLVSLLGEGDMLWYVQVKLYLLGESVLLVDLPNQLHHLLILLHIQETVLHDRGIAEDCQKLLRAGLATLGLWVEPIIIVITRDEKEEYDWFLLDCGLAPLGAVVEGAQDF